MLSQSSPEYIFKVIDRPIYQIKTFTKRAIICIVGTITGFLIAVALALALIFRRQVITT